MIDYTQLIQDVIDGNENPLKAYAMLTLLHKDIAKGISEIKEAALIEADKNPDKSFEDYGFKFEKRVGGASYDYKHIEEWQTYHKALKDCEERYKIALKSKGVNLMVATEDGEEMELPIVTYKSDSIIVK